MKKQEPTKLTDQAFTKMVEELVGAKVHLDYASRVLGGRAPPSTHRGTAREYLTRVIMKCFRLLAKTAKEDDIKTEVINVLQYIRLQEGLYVNLGEPKAKK